MSVATRNPFALLDEDDARPPSPPPPTAPAPAPPPQQPSASAKRARGGPATRGGKYYPRGGSRQNTDREPPSSEDPPVASDAKQRRPDGERRERGERGRGRGGTRGRGRTFDRHSATGKTDSDKKIHNGWGGDDGNAELKAEEAATIDAAAESGGLNDWAAPPAESGGSNDWAAPPAESGGLNDWAAPADTSAGDWGAPPQESAPEQSPDAEKPESTRRRDRDPEEEDNTLTLDQYLAQQRDKEAALLPKLETRKANEGAEDGIWDGAVRLEKSEGETYFSGKTKSAPKARTEKKEKVFLEIDAHFERPARGGRGRGGDRGEGRGRGGRGRGGRGRAANGTDTVTVSVDDETAFPSLS